MPLVVKHHDLDSPLDARGKAAALGRLLSKCEVAESGCWVWMGSRNTLGYANTVLKNQRWMAHRLAWVLAKGRIPTGKFICHKCDNPSCINPEHLFVGDHTENQRDMVAKGRHTKQVAVCLRGHPFDTENTKLYTDCHGSTHRRCIECERGRWARERAAGSADASAAPAPGDR